MLDFARKLHGATSDCVTLLMMMVVMILMLLLMMEMPLRW